MTHQEAGIRGGRPRLPTLEDRQQQSLEAINMKEVTDTSSSNNYKVLKGLCLQRYRSSSKRNNKSRELLEAAPGGKG